MRTLNCCIYPFGKICILIQHWHATWKKTSLHIEVCSCMFSCVSSASPCYLINILSYSTTYLIRESLKEEQRNRHAFYGRQFAKLMECCLDQAVHDLRQRREFTWLSHCSMSLAISNISYCMFVMVTVSNSLLQSGTFNRIVWKHIWYCIPSTDTLNHQNFHPIDTITPPTHTYYLLHTSLHIQEHK